MTFERFTDQSRRAVVLAQEEAARLDHDHIGTEHRARRPPAFDPVQALLDSIDERLSAIERHLGMDPGGPGNVVPPS